MDKTQAAMLDKQDDRSLNEKLVSIIGSLQIFYAPILVGMVSLLYSMHYPTQDVLLFSALGFSGLVLTIQFMRVGFWVAFALQIAFFVYMLEVESFLDVKQVLFSVAMVTASVVGLLYQEIDNEIETASPQQVQNEAAIVARIEKEEQRAELLYTQLQGLMERTQNLAMEREELIIEQGRLKAKVAQLVNEKEVQRIDVSHALEQAKNELAHMQKQFEQIAFDAETHKIHPAEAKYRQLRTQFEEKSKTLDETRKQLFYAEEQQQLLEKKLQEPSEEVLSLSKQVALLEECSLAMEKLHRKELESYEQLVEECFRQINASNSTKSHDHLV